jgi:DNA-binding IclR family transcriptional regulator
VAHGEVTPGVIGIAAPVFDGAAAPAAAICMTSAARSLDRGRIELLGRSIAARAAELTNRLTAGPDARTETYRNRHAET